MLSPLIWPRQWKRRIQQRLLIYLTILLSLIGLIRYISQVELQASPSDILREHAPPSTSRAPRRLPQVHLLLPVNKDAALRGSRFCKTAASAIMLGYKPIVYNWGSKPDDVSRTHRQKVTTLRDILASPSIEWPDDDLVFVIDALDVWLQLPPADLARRFASYDQGEVYVGAEKHCVPNEWESADCQNVPQSPLPVNLWTEEAMKPRQPATSSHARHANSGTILGRVDQMRRVSQELSEVIEADNYTYTGDQAAFNILLGRGDLAVDYYHRLFWPSASDDSHLKWMNLAIHPDAHLHGRSPLSYGISGAPVEVDDGIVPWSEYPTLGQHQWTGQVPVALHFNGRKGKDLLQEWWGMPWYSAERFRHLVIPRLANATINSMKRDGTISRTLRLKELCWDKTRGLYDGPPERASRG